MLARLQTSKSNQASERTDGVVQHDEHQQSQERLEQVLPAKAQIMLNDVVACGRLIHKYRKKFSGIIDHLKV